MPGIEVGHYTDKKALTGTTVIFARGGAVGGVDVRGSAPGTRVTDLLNPINPVDRVNAVVLSGGSVYGLAAADGVMACLEDQAIGWPVGGGNVELTKAQAQKIAQMAHDDMARAIRPAHTMLDGGGLFDRKIIKKIIPEF